MKSDSIGYLLLWNYLKLLKDVVIYEIGLQSAQWLFMELFKTFERRGSKVKQ